MGKGPNVTLLDGSGIDFLQAFFLLSRLQNMVRYCALHSCLTRKQDPRKQKHAYVTEDDATEGKMLRAPNGSTSQGSSK